MYIESKHLKIIKNILKKYPYNFYAFGSRITGTNLKKFSDLDLCIIEEMPNNIKIKLIEEFEESNLPYKVDIIDWNICNKEFQEIILKDMQLIQSRTNDPVTLRNN